MNVVVSNFINKNNTRNSFWVCVFLVNIFIVELLYVFSLMLGFEVPQVKDEYVIFLDELGWAAYFLVFLLIPLVEEFLFRLPVAYILKARWGVSIQYVSIAALQGLFVLGHAGNFSNPHILYLLLNQGVPMCVFLFVFVSFLNKTKSVSRALLASTAYHALYNVTVMLLGYFFA